MINQHCGNKIHFPSEFCCLFCDALRCGDDTALAMETLHQNIDLRYVHVHRKRNAASAQRITSPLFGKLSRNAFISMK